MKITSRSSPCTLSRFLTKNGSNGCAAKNALGRRIHSPQSLDLIHDRLRLRQAEGSDAEGQARRVASVLHHGPRDDLGLVPIGATACHGHRPSLAGDGTPGRTAGCWALDSGIRPAGCHRTPDSRPQSRSRAGCGSASAASARRRRGCRPGRGRSQCRWSRSPPRHRFLVARSEHVEEARRWQLLAVTDDDELAAPQDRAKASTGLTWLASSKMTRSNRTVRAAKMPQSTSGSS